MAIVRACWQECAEEKQQLRANLKQCKTLLKEAQTFLVEDLIDFGGCDHDANMCACSLIKLLEGINNALTKPDGKDGV